jgi:hypothetical protein
VWCIAAAGTFGLRFSGAAVASGPRRFPRGLGWPAAAAAHGGQRGLDGHGQFERF